MSAARGGRGGAPRPYGAPRTSWGARRIGGLVPVPTTVPAPEPAPTTAPPLGQAVPPGPATSGPALATAVTPAAAVTPTRTPAQELAPAPGEAPAAVPTLGPGPARPARPAPLPPLPTRTRPPVWSGSAAADWWAEVRRLIVLEARIQIPRPRTWITLAATSFVPILVTVAYAVGGTPHLGQGIGQAQYITLATESGFDMPLAALSYLGPYLLMVVAAIFLGESLTSEAGWGTLRALLTRPVTRSRLLVAKATVGTALSAVACVAATIVALVAGLLAFGWHPIVTPTGVHIGQGQALLRVAVAAGFVALSLAAVGAFALLLSTLTDSVIGAVAGGLGLSLLSEILDGIPTLGPARDILPTHFLFAWGGLLTEPVQLGGMVRGILIQIPYVVVCCGLARWWFNRKDVLS